MTPDQTFGPTIPAIAANARTHRVRASSQLTQHRMGDKTTGIVFHHLLSDRAASDFFAVYALVDC
jgi:hypothetical protein